MALVGTRRALLSTRPNWVLNGAAVDMDFANGLYYGGTLSQLLTTSRASIGYAATSNGLLVQFPANTLRVTNRGALIEESRTNISLQSQNFSSATWQVFGTGLGKVGVASANDPAGGSTAYEINMGSTGGAINVAGALFQAITFTAAAYTHSVYVMAKTGTSTIRVSITDGSAVTTGTADISINSTSWTRIPFTASTAAGAGNIAVRNNAAGNSGNIFVAFDQTELGSFATSYMPSSGTPVQRNADIVLFSGRASSVLTSSAGWGVIQTDSGNYVASAFLLGGSGASDYYIRQGSGGATTVQARMGGAAAGTATIGGAASIGTNTVKSGVTWNSGGFTIVGNNGTTASVSQALSLPTGVYLGGRNGSSMSSLYFPRATFGTSYIDTAIGTLTV